MKKLMTAFLIVCFTISNAFAVTVASWGGAYTESQIKGYGDPTEKKLGVDINWVDYSGGLAEIKAQKEANAITWDIMDVLSMDTIVGCDEGLFVEFEFDRDFPPAPDGTPASEDFFTSMPSKCAVGNVLYSWNYAYNIDAFSGKAPTTIQDFFDTKKFPGRRSVYKSALTQLEMALMAEGVDSTKIYDVLSTEDGLKRAINKFQALCTDPNGGCVFWSAGAQPPELLVAGEVVMATGFNGRFFNAEIGEGARIKQVWDGQGLDYEYFVLVKGGPNEDIAKKVIAEMTSTEMLAGSAKYISYAPWRKSSLEVMAKGEPWYKDGKTNMIPHMPTAPQNTKNYFLVDPIFWADNGVEIGEQWENMKSKL